MSYLWYGTRLSADVIYGSGLRSGFANTDHNAPYAQVNTGISHQYDIPGWAPVTLRFDVVNLFDVSYAIRNGTGIGVFAPQYGPRRGFYFGLSQKFGPGANTPAATPPAYLPLIPIQAVWTWTGFYMGGNVGYGSSRFNSDMPYSDGLGNTLLPNSVSTRHDGALGGGSGRLQLAVRHVAGGLRNRHELPALSHDNGLRVPGADLQPRHRFQCAGRPCPAA